MLEQFKTQYQKHHENDGEELECSFQTKARSETSMNVSDVKVADEDGYLSRSKTMKEKYCEETVGIHQRRCN